MSVYMGLAQLLTAVVFVWAARSLGVEGFGQVVVIYSASLTLAGLCDFGLQYFCTREVASGNITPEDVNSKVSMRLVVLALIAVCASAVATVLGASHSFWILPIMLTAGLGQSLHGTLRGAGLTTMSAFLQLLERFLLLLSWAVLSAVWLDADSALLVGACLSQLVAAGACRQLTPPAWRLRLRLRPSFNPWRGVGQFGVYAFFVTMQGFDVALLGIFASSQAAGQYGAVARWVAPLVLLGAAFSSSAAPAFARQKSARDALVLLWAVLPILSFAAAACLGVFLFADSIVDLVLGSEYAAAAVVLKILCVAAVLNLVNQPVATFLISRGGERVASAAVVLSVSVQLGAIAVLSPDYGALAAGGASAVAQSIMLCCLWIGARRLRDQHAKRRTVPRGPGTSRLRSGSWR